MELTTPDLITVCIPTYNRPELLAEAIRSCLAQAYRPIEIVVGDDSGDDRSGAVIASLDKRNGAKITYIHHKKNLGQSRNVNFLFDQAQGARLMLLHDDDYLLPGALAALDAAWRSFACSDCVFGRQIVVNANGEMLQAETKAADLLYRRQDLRSGSVDKLVAGLSQHIPNNAFLVKTILAKRVRYRSEKEVGHSVDADFGIRLAMHAEGHFIFLPQPVSAYRLTQASIMRSASQIQGHHLFYSEVEKLTASGAAAHSKAMLLDRIAPAALLDAIDSGERSLARQIFSSYWYARHRWSPHTLLAAIMYVYPSIGRKLRQSYRRHQPSRSLGS